MRIFIGAPRSVFHKILVDRLRGRGYLVETSAEAADARFRLGHEHYDLAILDMHLPGAIHTLETARRRDPVLPILISHSITSTAVSRIHYLDLGADDCVNHAAHIEETEAKIRALLRRNRHKATVLTCGALKFDTISRTFWVGRNALTLPSKEHALLEALITRPGKMQTKLELASTLYSTDDDTPVDTVHLYIHRLRRRLQRSGAEIETHRGIGYLLRPQRERVLLTGS